MAILDKLIIFYFYLCYIVVLLVACGCIAWILEKIGFFKWLRGSWLGVLLGLETRPDTDGITAADVMDWNARNIPANDE